MSRRALAGVDATPRRGRWRDVLVVALPIQATFLCLYYYPSPKALFGDELTYVARAAALVDGSAGPPDFVWPPLQSLLLAASFRLFGPTLLPVQLLQIGLLWGGGLLLRGIARAVGLSVVAADVCLVSYLCYPTLVAFSHYLWPEVTHLFLALLAVRAVLARRAGADLGAGLALGVALGFKSLLGPFVPLFAAAAAWPDGRGIRWRGVVLLLLGVVAGCGPLLLYDGIRYGYWGIASSGAINAWVGLNDRSPRNLVGEIVVEEMDDYLAASPDPHVRQARAWSRVRDKVREQGIAATLAGQLPRQYQRLLDKDSFFTDQLPGGPAASYADIGPMATLGLRLGAYALYGLLLVAAVLGMAAPMPPGVVRALRPFLLFLLGNLALFAILHVKTRYRVQLLPVLFLYAAALWDHVAGNLGHRAWSKSRIAGAALALVVTLWLAFGSKGP